MKNDNWIDHPAFFVLKNRPDEYINTDENHFEYLNLNPHGRIGQRDQVFQILRFFLPESSDEEIAKIIFDEKIAHGIMRIDRAAANRILKKAIGMEYVRTKEKPRTDDFARTIEEKGTVVVCMSNYTFELFDAESRKFKGCHPILNASSVLGYWRK